ncbi:MAG: fasciclin domain-containing protein [Thermoleophilia bacterium]
MRSKLLAAGAVLAVSLGLAACGGNDEAEPAPAPAPAPAESAAPAEPAPAESAPTAGAKDIVDTAVEAGSFTTLAAALQAAGLVDALKGEGPFTVFAPTDEAFAKLDPATLEDLLKPENKDQLTKILQYHVVPGKVLSSDLTDGQMAATLEGGDLTISLGDTVKVNDATVVTPDIEASNGVIHVIDTVLIPADS